MNLVSGTPDEKRFAAPLYADWTAEPLPVMNVFDELRRRTQGVTRAGGD
jgi:hypothetical protein